LPKADLATAAGCKKQLFFPFSGLINVVFFHFVRKKVLAETVEAISRKTARLEFDDVIGLSREKQIQYLPG
jgi:hypothetical protein